MSRFRQSMSSEILRPTVAVVLSLVIGAPLYVWGLAPIVAVEGLVGALFTPGLMFVGLLGIIYFVLTRATFHPLRDVDLRDELNRTAPPKSKFTRLLLGVSPSAWALFVSSYVLLAILALILSDSASGQLGVLAAAFFCLVGSWLLLLTVYAVEYARVWASSDAIEIAGGSPRMSDFFYLAGQVSTSFSPGDVRIVSSEARSLVFQHGIMAFAFSTAAIGLFVSVAIARLV